MRQPLLIALVGALALPVSAPAEGLVLEPSGLRVPVPAGWEHRYDRKTQVLLVAGPGGVRGRLDVATTRRSGVDSVASYKADGRTLIGRHGKVKVLGRPTPGGKLGDRPAHRYGFAYKDSARLSTFRAWVATGTAREQDRHLQVTLRLWGPRHSMDRHVGALKHLVRGVRWPAPEPAEEAPVPTDQAGWLGDRPPVLELITPASPARVAAAPRVRERPRPGAVLQGHDPNARAYDRGSLSGGVGFMREASVIRDAAKARKLQEAFRIQDRGERSEAEKARAAAYLGFDL